MALRIDFSHGQHHRTHRAPPALQRLRMEGLALMSGGLGHLHRDGAGGCVDAFGLVAVGVALPVRGAFVKAGRGKALALDLHGQLEGLCEDGRNLAWPVNAA